MTNLSGTRKKEEGRRKEGGAARKVKIEDLTDRDILLACLEHPSKLSEVEKKEFDKWSLAMDSHSGYELTERQREWVRKTFTKLDLLKSFDEEALASPTKVTGEKMVIQGQDHLEALMGPKPMKPPASRRRYA